jgi:hypothetical protein
MLFRISGRVGQKVTVRTGLRDPLQLPRLHTTLLHAEPFVTLKHRQRQVCSVLTVRWLRLPSRALPVLHTLTKLAQACTISTAGSIVHAAGGGGRIYTDISESFHGLFPALSRHRTLSLASHIPSDRRDVVTGWFWNHCTIILWTQARETGFCAQAGSESQEKWIKFLYCSYRALSIIKPQDSVQHNALCCF